MFYVWPPHRFLRMSTFQHLLLCLARDWTMSGSTAHSREGLHEQPLWCMFHHGERDRDREREKTREREQERERERKREKEERRGEGVVYL